MIDLTQGVQPVDVGGAIREGQTIKSQGIQLQQQQEDQADSAAMKTLMSLPDVDPYTAKGFGEMLGHAKGRISPKAMMSMTKVHNDMQNAEYQQTQHLSGLHEDELKKVQDTTESFYSALDGIDKVSDPQEFEDKKRAAAAKMSTAKYSDGSPMFDNATVQGLLSADQNSLVNSWKQSKAFKNNLSNLKLQAETAKTQASADAMKAGGKVKNEYIDTADQSEVRIMENGNVLRRAKGSDEWEPGRLTDTLRQVAHAATVNETKQADKKKAMEDPWAVTGLVEQAVKKAVTGENISFGTSGELKEPGELLSGMIATDPKVVRARNLYKSTASVLSQIEKQEAMLGIGEQTVNELIPALKSTIANQDPSGTGIKSLNDILLKAQMAWGDPSPFVTQQYITSLQADIGRVQSGMTGAAATPVAFVKKGEVYVPTGLSESNYPAILKAVDTEMKARTNSVKAKKEELLSSQEQAMKAGMEAADRVRAKWSGGGRGSESSTTPTEDTNPGVMTEEDARKELMKAREAYRTTTDPKQKEMAAQVVKSLESKIGGGGKPTPTQKDLDYLKAHPDQKANFERHFGAQP